MATRIETLTGGAVKQLPSIRLTRKRIIALALIIVGILMVFQTPTVIDEGITTTLTLESGEVDQVSHVVIPTVTFAYAVGIFYLVSGALSLLDVNDILNRLTFIMLTIGGLLFIPSILIIAAAGDSTNITTMIAESLRLATPIAIGAMAGIWCERSGVINIAIEGMMLFAACFGFVTVYFLNSVFPSNQLPTVQFIAVVVAIISGGIIALLHAWLSITFRTDQIVSGTVINILALGVTSFVRRQYLASTEAGTSTLQDIRIPVLADIPVVGEALFNNQPIFYMMFVVIIITHIMLYQTRWGLRIRAVGEHPHAADTLGINVNRSRWTNVFIAGLIAGLAGAWFSLEATGTFNDGMTRGAGFIALAAMIFGKWTPVGAFGAALLFGFSDAMGTRLQIIDVDFPVQFLQMVPYVVTIVVLAGFIGRASPPKAIGEPYIKE